MSVITGSSAFADDDEPRVANAHHRHPRNRDPAEIGTAQLRLRLLGDDDVGRCRHHRRDPRGQARGGLRLQLDRPLRLRRADAGAFHSANSQGRSEIAHQRGRRQSRSGKNPRRDDAEREVRRPQRALGRHRHHRGRGVGRSRQDRRQAAASRARRALQRRQGAGQDILLRRRRLVRARQDHQGLAGRDAAASGFRLHHGEDEGRRRVARRGHEPHRGSEVRGRQPRRACGRRQLASSSATRRSNTPRRCRPTSCAGTRSPAIRSTSRRSRISPTPTTARCRPARTCSRPRTSTTWCASAA